MSAQLKHSLLRLYIAGYPWEDIPVCLSQWRTEGGGGRGGLSFIFLGFFFFVACRFFPQGQRVCFYQRGAQREGAPAV